jgi:hypothetical protein
MSQEDAWLFEQPLHDILHNSPQAAEVIALDWLYEFIRSAIKGTDLCVATLKDKKIHEIEPLLPNHLILALAKIFLRGFPAEKPKTPEALSQLLQSFTGMRENEIEQHADLLLRTIILHVRSGCLIVFTNRLGETLRIVDSRIPFAPLQPAALKI